MIPAICTIGVVGTSLSLTELASRITRKRVRGSGSKIELAKKLESLLKERANRKWAKAIKGQRTLTVKQAAQMAKEIIAALDKVQHQFRARLLTTQEIVLVARHAADHGSASDDGGKVKASSSYGYTWTTSTANAIRQQDGSVAVKISRSSSETVSFPAKWWNDFSFNKEVLKGGGEFAIRAGKVWNCYTGNQLTAVAVDMPADLQSRFGTYEHGVSVEKCHEEITRKRAIIDAAEAKIAASEKSIKRTNRMASLLAKIGTNVMIGFDDARAVGFCEAGIRAFAAKVGVTDLDSKIPLATIFTVEPERAVVLARKVIASRTVNIV